MMRSFRLVKNLPIMPSSLALIADAVNIELRRFNTGFLLGFTISFGRQRGAEVGFQRVGGLDEKLGAAVVGLDAVVDAAIFESWMGHVAQFGDEFDPLARADASAIADAFKQFVHSHG